jgi:hypothetical protein
MKPFATSLAIILLGAASFALAQVNLPNPQTPGMSPETAVRLMVTSDLMLDRSINRWLRQHYPGWNADPHEIMEIGMERYAVVFISTSNQPSRRVYFRIASSPGEDSEAGFPSR